MTRLTTTLALSLLVCASSTATESAKPKLGPPSLSIEDALTVAKELIQTRQVDTVNSYLGAAQFEPIATSKGSFWTFTWLDNRYATGQPIKGGQIWVRVYMDRSTEMYFHN